MSSNLFASIVNSLSNGIYVLQDNRAVYLNQRFGEIFGYESLEPLLMCDMYETVYPDRSSVDFFRGVHDQMLASGQTKAAWGQASAKCDGTPIWLDVEAQTVMLNGRPAIMGMFHDFTECKLLGEAMFVSQETLRLLLDAMEDRVYVVTDDLKIVYANQKMMATLCGDINTELCHKVCRGLDTICVDCSAEEVFNSNKPMYKEFYNEITHKWYSVIELAIRMPGINRPAKLAVARDITDRKESEGRIRALSHRLLNVHEDERKRLSRELHDDLGQRLNAVKIGVDTLAEDLANFPPEIYNHVNNLSTVLQASIESVRSICAGLRPASLEMSGLVEAIKRDCANLTELHGLKIDLKSTGMKKISLDSDAEINLYRVFQESLNNIVKHAKASEVRISLIASHPIIRMRIEDNGKGFDILERKAKNDNRLGLVGIAERVDLMGGTFKMASRPGQGTRIVVEIPYSS